MADSPISSLQAVQNLPNGQPDIGMTDLFVLEQNNTAKKLTGEQITKFVDRNVVSYEGEIVASDAAGGARYRNETLTLVLPHGPGIASIEKTSTRPATAQEIASEDATVDTYTITSQDVRTTNGLTPGVAVGEFTVYNGRNGTGAVNTVANIAPPFGSTDIPKFELFNLIYPLHSIYMTEDATFDPNEAFGGEWTQIKDRFLLAASDLTAESKTYTVGDEDGYETQTVDFSNGVAHIGFADGSPGNQNIFLSRRNVAEDPTQDYEPVKFAAANSAAVTWGNPPIAQADATELSGTQQLSNMPPYHVVCVWKRTALAT